MREHRLRARRFGLVAVAAAVLIVAGVAGYALGAPHRRSPLRRVDLPAQQVRIGALQSPAAIPPLCAGGCPAAP